MHTLTDGRTDGHWLDYYIAFGSGELKIILQFPEEKYFYFSMAEMYDLGFIKSFTCLYTNLLNLPFLENLCTVCVIFIHLFHTCLYYMYK